MDNHMVEVNIMSSVQFVILVFDLVVEIEVSNCILYSNVWVIKPIMCFNML